VTKTYDFKGFDRIRIRGPFDIEIKRIDGFSIRVDADILKPVQVSKNGDTLEVGLPWYYYLWGFIAAWNRASVRINLPELHELRLSGAASGTVDNFSTTHDISLSLAGASRLDLGTLECGNALIRLTGASRINLKTIKTDRVDMDIVGASRLKGELAATGEVRLKMAGASQAEFEGRANSLKLDIAGAGRASLSNLSVKSARVRLVGASKAVVNVEGRLDAELAGASDLSWVGNPIMGDIKSVGASQLHRA
jgi:hypothetical protein